MRGGRKVLPIYRPALFLISFGALSLALIGPFDFFGSVAFWPHMIQHMLLIVVAAPAMLGSAPMPVFLWALPYRLRIGVGGLLERDGIGRKVLSVFTTPRVALPIAVVALWVWHYPPAYQLALSNSYVHFAEHATMFAAAMMFWWPIIGPAPVRSKMPYPLRMFYIVFAVTPTAALAALITFSNGVIYPFYEDTPRLFGIMPKEDQVLAGLILWLPGNFAYFVALTALFFIWSSREMRNSLPGVK